MNNERNDKGQFVKGYKETEEMKAKRSKALREQWKDRKEYIGDIKKNYPSIYNTWRAFMFTEKGKKAGHSEEWSNCRNFFNDVISSYTPGDCFRRKDTTLPFSKENFMWVKKEVIKDLQTTVYLTYNGESLNLRQWSEKLGINYNGIKSRYYKGKNYTPEEILFGKKKVSRGKVTSISTISDEQEQRNKISKMLSAYRCKDKKKGYNTTVTREYLESIIRCGKCIYCGDTERLGLDRIDNNRGHEIENVVPCCYECNCARNNNFTFEEMMIIGKAIQKVKNKRKENESINKKDCKKS